jgi:AcrR family transcriptional regulator
MVSNKELQEKRMRGYFIEAAKEILKGEGIKALNVRAVSERAGYSFATLYNYFKDLNELTFICVQDFLDECDAFADAQSLGRIIGVERLKIRMKAVINYFTQYPGIFELCFVEKMNDLGSRQSTGRMIFDLTDKIASDDLGAMIADGLISDSQAKIIGMSLRNSIAGMLIFYLNRLQPADYKEFMKIVENQLDSAIGLNEISPDQI